MNAKTFKDPVSKQETDDGNYPEIDSPVWSFPEPSLDNKRISVSGYNIKHGI